MYGSEIDVGCPIPNYEAQVTIKKLFLLIRISLQRQKFSFLTDVDLPNELHVLL